MSNNSYVYCTLDSSFVPDSIKALSRIGDCVKAISDLPNRVLTDLQFLPGSPEEEELIEGIKQIYYWKERWLSYYLLDQHQLKSHLLSTDGRHFKSHAELSVAYYRLCEEAHRHPGWTQQFESAAGLWFTCEYQMCREGLENSGLTGTPCLISKREHVSNKAKFWGKTGREDTQETTGLFGNPEKIVGDPKELVANPQKPIYPGGYKPGMPVKTISPFEMLLFTAFCLAKVDTKFRQKLYRDYQKTTKRHARAILNNKNLGGVCITPSGDLIDTQSTANLPGSRLRKRKKKGSKKKKCKVS